MSAPSLPSPNYHPAMVPASEWGPGERDRAINYPVYAERSHFQATVYGFAAGGFEATVRIVDIQTMSDAAMRPRGVRKAVEERDERDVVRSVARAKKTLRHAVKQIGCDHLLTLTTRQEKNSPEELNRRWKSWVRSYREFTGEAFPYVAVPERHPSRPDHWHLHVAVRGGMYGKHDYRGVSINRLDLARRLWWRECGGKGMGNIDIKRIKVGTHADGTPKGPLVRAERIARYISKYMTKDLMFAHRPDKKRYWRSEFDLPEARRYWLQSRPSLTEKDGSDFIIPAAFHELRSRLGQFDPMRCSFFFFPDGSGFWFSYNPHAGPTSLGDTPVPF